MLTKINKQIIKYRIFCRCLKNYLKNIFQLYRNNIIHINILILLFNVHKNCKFYAKA
jgi:hypothetical protein